jgi:hypothetical protein
MNWRSITALILLAFIGGGAGFAWLSSSGTLPWESSKDGTLPAEPEAQPTLAPPSAGLIQPSASQAEALLLVLSARQMIQAGEPLGDLGSRLQASFGQSQPQALAIIAQATRKPLSNGALLASFDAIAPQLTLPVGTVWDRLQHELGSLFVIRSADAKQTRSQSAINKARKAILKGDIADAARIVRTLPGAANAKDWLAQANRAIAVSQALDVLNGAALAAPVAAPAPAMTSSEPDDKAVQPLSATDQ